MVILNSFGYPESQIRHEQRNVRAILDKKDLGLGTLFVSESTLCWKEKDNIGFCVGYHDITLHAISRDQSVYPGDCVYIMLDGQLFMPGDAPQNVDDNEEEDDDDDNSDVESHHEVSEIILVPSDDNEASVPTIYEAIKICQELNPDPQDMDDDDLYADAEDEFDEGHYFIGDRGAGDADVEDLTRRMQDTVSVTYAQNGNDEDEFQDAD